MSRFTGHAEKPMTGKREGDMTRRLIGIPILGLAFLCVPPPCSGAEIPTDLDPISGDTVATLQAAGFPADQAQSKAQALDRAELAELARSDLRRQGGTLTHDEKVVLFTLVTVLAILLVVGI